VKVSFKEKLRIALGTLKLAQVRTILDKGVAGQLTAQLVQVEKNLIVERKEHIQSDFVHLGEDLKVAERGAKAAVGALATRVTLATTEADFAAIEGEYTALQEGHRVLQTKIHEQSQQIQEVANRLAGCQPFSQEGLEQKRLKLLNLVKSVSP